MNYREAMCLGEKALVLAGVVDAKNDACILSVMYGGTRATVFRCIIPKGTKYYKGLFGMMVPSYCSNAIIVKEPVCNFK